MSLANSILFLSNNFRAYSCDGCDTPPIPKEEKFPRISIYFFAATTQPIRMPGACKPFVAAPATKILELLISFTNFKELIGGV